MKAKIPNLTLSTDIIVGFAGETEEDFEDTLDVVRKVCFEQVYMFIYSRRVGTPADKMENQVPEEQKHIRFNKLIDIIISYIKNWERYEKFKHCKEVYTGYSLIDGCYVNCWLFCFKYLQK